MRIFYVYQGDSYTLERDGSYVWSPKLATNGSKNAGYSMMTKVKEGDLILHHCKGELKAISKVKSDCKEGVIPAELKEINNKWGNEGYKIETIYTEINKPLVVKKYKDWLKENYTPNSAFTREGGAKQQYMCALNEKHALFLLEKIFEGLDDKEKFPKDLSEDVFKFINKSKN